MLFKVLDVHVGKLAFRLVKLVGIGPGRLWKHQMSVNTVQRRRDLETKDWVRLHFNIMNGSIQDCVKARARGMDRHAFANTIGSTGPSRIHKKGRSAMLVQLLLQQVGVPSGVERHECGSKARGKVGGRFENATFRASYLGRVAAQKVIHGLSRTELGHGRQDTKGVATEKDDIIGMSRDLRLVLQRGGEGEGGTVRFVFR